MFTFQKSIYNKDFKPHKILIFVPNGSLLLEDEDLY